MSERVLSEKLFEEGTSFRAILNDVIADQAKLLLTDSRLPIKEIAARLGYSKTPNFHRAFCKATGITPLRFRINNFPHSF
jgi:AraC-like DNA-binding protein